MLYWQVTSTHCANQLQYIPGSYIWDGMVPTPEVPSPASSPSNHPVPPHAPRASIARSIGPLYPCTTCLTELTASGILGSTNACTSNAPILAPVKITRTVSDWWAVEGLRRGFLAVFCCFSILSIFLSFVSSRSCRRHLCPRVDGNTRACFAILATS